MVPYTDLYRKGYIKPQTLNLSVSPFCTPEYVLSYQVNFIAA